MKIIEKRSQLERLTICEGLLTELWEEIRQEQIDPGFGLLTAASECQVEINRIVWKLNEINNKKQMEGEK